MQRKNGESKAEHRGAMERKHGGKVDHEKKEHEKKEHKRARGGKMAGDSEFVETMGKKEEGPEEEAEGKVHGRKRGGRVNGKMAMHRPDRRARGGATSDQDPLTSAGKMSVMPYEAKQAKGGSEGMGPDRD